MPRAQKSIIGDGNPLMAARHHHHCTDIFHERRGVGGRNYLSADASISACRFQCFFKVRKREAQRSAINQARITPVAR
jgi:hypothetical protein